jgi:hypothetical protein
MSRIEGHIQVPFFEEDVFGVMDSWQTAMMKWGRQLHMQCYKTNFYGSKISIDRHEYDKSTHIYFIATENHVQFVGGI